MAVVLGKRTAGSRLFDFINYTLMALIFIVTVYPFYNQVILSLASSKDIYSTGLLLYPHSLWLKGWETMLHYTALWRGYFNTIIRTLLGITISVFFTSLMAYPLSKKELPFNGIITKFILVTMYFGGGLIPNYILIKNLNMFNTIWVMVIPGMISGFNVFIMRNFFRTIPESIEDSAKIDGASHINIFFRIVLPLSVPVIATVSLWVGVGHWQEWYSNVLYIQQPQKWVMMMVARKILVEQVYNSLDAAGRAMGSMSTIKGSPDERQMRACVIVASVLPMLLAYPFLQKYFVKGITLGAVKG